MSAPLQKTPPQESSERSRVIVVREDGSKVVKVRKRRKALDLKPEPSLIPLKRKAILWSVSLLAVGGLALAGFGVFRMTQFNTEAYRLQLAARIQDATGASSVTIDRFNATPAEFAADTIVIKFDQHPTLKSITISNLRAKLSFASFLGNTWRGTSLTANNTRCVLNPASPASARSSAAAAISPRELREIFRFDSIRFTNAAVFVGSEDAPLASITGADGYAPLPPQDSNLPLSIDFEKGTSRIGAWAPFQTVSGSLLIKPDLSAQLAIRTLGQNSAPTDISAHFAPDQPLNAVTFEVSTLKLPLSALTANLTANLIGGEASSNRITAQLPQSGQQLPPFRGDFAIDYLTLQPLPFLNRLSTLFKSSHFNQPRFLTPTSTSISWSPDAGLNVAIPDLVAANFMAVNGAFSIKPDRALSGNINVGLPEQLVLRDTGSPHRMFKSQSRGFYWFPLELSGSADSPTDNVFAVMTRLSETPQESAPAPRKPDGDKFGDWIEN